MLGRDRALFSTNYPYQMEIDGEARRFFEEAELQSADREKFASLICERLASRMRSFLVTEGYLTPAAARALPLA